MHFMIHELWKKHDVGGLPVRRAIKLAALSVSFCLSLAGIIFAAALPGWLPVALADDLKDLKGHWAAAEIERAVSTGYVKGYPDGSFKPDAGVTRAEFVAMANGAFKIAAAPDGSSFKDVHSTDWFAENVKAASASGFVSGYPDGTFRPQQTVNRQEASSMLSKLLKLDGEGQLGFSDAGKIDSWARPFVVRLVNKGIISGYPDKTFRPQKVISRAEAVVMINRALDSGAPGSQPTDSQLTQVTAQLQVADDIVNVRSGPSQSDAVIGQAHFGEILQADAKSSDNWYRISWDGGTGWVAGWCVQVYQSTDPPAATPATTKLQVVDDIVNVRSGPSQSDAVIGQVRAGEILQADAKSKDNWYRISWDGGTGWVAGWCVQVYQSTDPPPQTTPTTGPGTLQVTVRQDKTGAVVDIKGAQGTFKWVDKTNPQRLLVTAPGITAVGTPLEIVVGAGGLDKIVTRYPGTATGTAEVELFFIKLPDETAPVPLVYSTAQGASGELLITLPPQIYQVQAVPISDFLAVTLKGTSSLSFQSSTQSGSPSQLVFDFAGVTLNSSMKSWKKQLDTLGFGSVQLTQQQSDLARLSVQVGANASYTKETGAGGAEVTLWIYQPAAKQELLSKAAAGQIYYGIDTAFYPGDDAMQAWWNSSPYVYAGFYLGPAPHHQDDSYMKKRQALVNQGWGLMPIYVGLQAYNSDKASLNTQTAIAHAAEAVTLAVYAGFPVNTTIFLDVEPPSDSQSLSTAYLNYIVTWANEVRGKGYVPAIYCHIKNADQLRGALAGDIKFWVARYLKTSLPTSKLTPADSTISFANIWQFAGNESLTYGGRTINVDLNVGTLRDPSKGS